MSEFSAEDLATLASVRAKLEQRKLRSLGLTPHTPPAQRTASTFSSPGSVLGKEDDVIIIELTQRQLYAGIEGDSGPQCAITFGPENNRRVGDYRIWMPAYKRRRETLDTWGRDYELWRQDKSDVDLGLLSDVLERTVREAYGKHLLTDAGTGRLVLVLPSIVPHPVLETMLSTLFQRWKFPSITLFPSPTTAIVAAGLRSGLVVDIGWEETVITPIYELREIGAYRSTRAMKMLTRNVAAMLKGEADLVPDQYMLRFDLDMIEEILTKAAATIDPQVSRNGTTMSETVHPEVDRQSSSGDNIGIDWPGLASSYSVPISKQKLFQTIDTVFMGGGEDAYFDDDEVPLPQLIYKALLSLSADLRGTCMSRIVFTHHNPTPLIRQHILKRCESIVKENAWTVTKSKKGDGPHSVESGRLNRDGPPDARHNVQMPTEKDVDEKILRLKAKSTQPAVQGHIREVHTLGPWAGASLLTSMKIRGFVEVERERFLSHGLAGASRDNEISVIPQQRLGGLGLTTVGRNSDRTGWTLGGWG